MKVAMLIDVGAHYARRHGTVIRVVRPRWEEVLHRPPLEPPRRGPSRGQGELGGCVRRGGAAGRVLDLYRSIRCSGLGELD